MVKTKSKETTSPNTSELDHFMVLFKFNIFLFLKDVTSVFILKVFIYAN